MPTWDYAATYPSSSSPKPALAHTLSKRRAEQLRSARRELELDLELAGSNTPEGNDTPFPRQSTSEDDLRGEHRGGTAQEGSPPPHTEPLAQRTVRRKKSSFDLRDLFLTGGLLRPSGSPASDDA